ncbi:unnamed protein product [Callosobruchus maculatus]|uniref:NodB homology domain-containing protein n=1 Tax=Callosobruchus maculatus TaxID=64391 RepID=A0A653D430_CALMS|nr:unnamed protein product [Callosobruchus maculatus]
MRRVVFWLCVLSISVAPAICKKGQKAPTCPSKGCEANKNCRCSDSSFVINKDNLDEYPQLVSLVTDDALEEAIYNDIWLPLISTYQNPDGSPIVNTFFVPHEYTDYKIVNELYNYGQEIAVNSITKNNLQDYWRKASEETLTKEFLGMKKILTKFANIPSENILGVRTPQFQLAGNHTIAAYQAADLKYDSSWPTLPSLPLFPYTLDFASTQQCTLGSECPNEAFPGFWILPINDLAGKNGKECNVLYNCNIT